MIGAFAEGVAGIVLPCSLALLLPLTAVPLTVDRRPVVATGIAFGGAVAAMWLRATALLPAAALGAGTVSLGTGMAGAVVAWLHRRPRGVTAWVLPLVPGLLGGMVWQPCVGSELGRVLEAASRRTFGSVFGLGAYGVGVLLPVLAVALARVAWGRAERQARPVALAGAVLGMTTAFVAVSGLGPRVVGWLVRVSI